MDSDHSTHEDYRGRHNIHADEDNSSNSDNAIKYNNITIIEGATIFTPTKTIQVTPVMLQNTTMQLL